MRGRKGWKDRTMGKGKVTGAEYEQQDKLDGAYRDAFVLFMHLFYKLRLILNKQGFLKLLRCIPGCPLREGN